MERIEGPTPNGGSYAECHYFDSEGHVVEKKYAKNVIISEFDSEGHLICETNGFFENNESKNIDEQKEKLK